jgi:hypothetical protein
MRTFRGLCIAFLAFGARVAVAQVAPIDPQIVTRADLGRRVTVVQVAPRFVTAVRLPEAISSVVVGDPAQFQVEHSEHEPKLVFVKAISAKPAETNVLVSTSNGRQVSLLLISRGEIASSDRARLDFLLKYEPTHGFFIAPSGFPFALVGETVPLGQEEQTAEAAPKSGNAAPYRSRPSVPPGDPPEPKKAVEINGLDKLVEEQESGPLPVLYGEHVSRESIVGDCVRAGVSRVIDEGQEVVVLFSAVNPTKRAILLMPPQVQLGGMVKSGKLIRHTKWSTAEQLAVLDFRLNRRRIGPGERADGVVVFERPPYKQSNEMLLLQEAESGAVDRPALAPIGFGISTAREDRNGRGK